MNNINLVVKKIPKFPFPIEKTFNITIGPKEEDGELTNSMSDTLVIQIRKPVGTRREIAVIDFGFKDMLDNVFNGDFMEVKSWHIEEENKLFVALAFTSLADNQILEIYHLNVFSTAERRMKLLNLKLAKNLYRSNITLDFPSAIEIIVNSVVNSSFQLPMRSTVDAVCRAHNKSEAKPLFHAIKNMKVISNSSDRNEAKLQFLVSKAVHQKNLTCQVGDSRKSINIQVLHAPTKIRLEPKVENVVGNGTGITCVAADGFPIPRITWTFVDGPKNASQFYTISPYNQRLSLSENAPIGSRWKFKCSSINEIIGTEQMFSSNVTFEIAYKMRNNSKENVTSRCQSKHWNMSENSDNCLIRDIKRTISNHSQKINKLETNEKFLKIELQTMAQTVELLKHQIKDQNADIEMLKKDLAKVSKPGSHEVVSKQTELSKKSSSAKNKFVVTFRWKVGDISRLWKKQKYVKSSRLKDASFAFPIKFELLFKSRSTILISLYMYPMHGKSIPASVMGVANMTIYNAGNPTLYKSIRKDFTKRHRSLMLDFLFTYYELYDAKILKGDQIVIQCSLEIPSQN